MAASITYNDLKLASGALVHYLEAGSPSLPHLVILHGYPTSSNQYLHLIRLLAATGKYHVLAPDLPGFGLTTVPSEHVHNFANMATVIGGWLDTLEISNTAVYTNDYGSPTAIRLALARPTLFTAIISQSGNAYLEGLVPSFWDTLRTYWATAPGSTKHSEIREKITKDVLTLAATKWQYEHGVPFDRLPLIDPLLAWTDTTQNLVPEKQQTIQLDLFYDYQTNLELYPAFQKYLRESGVKVLVIWGRNDEIFGPAGAQAWKRDVKDAKIVLIDGGHFLAQTHASEVADVMAEFLDGGEW